MSKNVGTVALVVLAAVLALAGNAVAQGCTDAAGCEALSEGTTKMGLAIGAGLAIGLAAIGTGLAQKDIGAAAVGAIAEDAGFLGRGILMVAIPETLVIFGFVVAFLLYGKMG